MKKLWLLIIFWMAILGGMSQNYSAKVYDGVTYMPVAGAHVYNTKQASMYLPIKRVNFRLWPK